MRAWHFLRATEEHPTGVLRDGRPAPPDGEWLEHDGPVEMCASGLHVCKRVIDALNYAPGMICCYVDLRDVVEQRDDKCVGRRRKIIWRVDASNVISKWVYKKRRFRADDTECRWHSAWVPHELVLDKYSFRINTKSLVQVAWKTSDNVDSENRRLVAMLSAAPRMEAR